MRSATACPAIATQRISTRRRRLIRSKAARGSGSAVRVAMLTGWSPRRSLPAQGLVHLLDDVGASFETPAPQAPQDEVFSECHQQNDLMLRRRAQHAVSKQADR